MNTADVTVEHTCAREEMVRQCIEDIHFDRYQLDYDILSIAPGSIPEADDECSLPDYRHMHGLEVPANPSRWAFHVPAGCTNYVARVRLHDRAQGVITRERILAIPFGDHDLGFSIDHIGNAV